MAYSYYTKTPITGKVRKKPFPDKLLEEIKVMKKVEDLLKNARTKRMERIREMKKI